MAEREEAVLIVDRERHPVELFQEAAEEMGFCVHTCTDNLAAWKCFERVEPRIIVLGEDVGLETIDLCKRIKASRVGQYVNILIMREAGRAVDLEMALGAGADYFMKKPVPVEFFRAWLSVARRNVWDLMDHEERNRQLEESKLEVAEVNQQLEDSILRANELTMEAERAYLQVNQILKTVRGALILIDKDHNIVRYNDQFLEMVGIEAGGEVDGSCFEEFHSELCNTPNCPLVRISNGEDYVESRIVRDNADGSKTYFDIVSSPFYGVIGDFRGIVEHITDVTKRVMAEEALKKSEERYRRLSKVDELTGLFNKRYFNQTILAEIDRSKRYGNPLSLVMMDIDNFKHHNDTYGHAEGDKVLERLGQILSSTVRTTDFACRYGGEEFAIVMPNTNSAGAQVLAERIRGEVAAQEFYPLPGERVCKTISLGLTEFVGGDDRESLIKRADANLYKAKETGKNRVVAE